jgi:hypothetical protein
MGIIPDHLIEEVPGPSESGKISRRAVPRGGSDTNWLAKSICKENRVVGISRDYSIAIY